MPLYGDKLTAAYGSGVDNLTNVPPAVVTSGGSFLTDDPVTVNVDSTSQFPSSGTLYIRCNAGVYPFTYTSKGSTTLNNCLTTPSATVVFQAGNEVFNSPVSDIVMT